MPKFLISIKKMLIKKLTDFLTSAKRKRKWLRIRFIRPIL